MRKYGRNLVVILLGFLILCSCGKLERKGSAPSNVPPQVYFSDIPPEGYKFSVTPLVYWFGTDVDGFITAYQYAVMESANVVSIGGLEKVKSYLHGIPRDSVSWVDSTNLKHMLGVHIQAEPGGSQSHVQMYAEMDPTIYTPQYLFLRAVDNGGAVSDVVYKLFYRNNHRPEAFIDMDSAFKVNPHYCLEETTATWKGIPITWFGLDTADYKDKRNQPEFQFQWELVGPFVSAPTPSIADKAPIADSSWDSILIAGSWQYSRWVSEKTHVFMGLEDFGDSAYGWYQLKVKAQDDAFTTTDTSTRMNFLIVKPRFRYADKNRKTILVVDATTYKGKAGSADTSIDVRPFYQQALSQSGLCEAFKIWYDPITLPDKTPKSPPGEQILSQYDLVIVLNMGASPGITEESFKKYKDYLDIGGRLWLIGLDNFGFNASGYNNNPHYFKELGTASTAYKLGTEYFGLDQVFVPTYGPTDDYTLEFIQAKPFGSWDNILATLDVDTVLCKKLKGFSYNTGYRFGVQGIPYVCYVAMSNFTDFEYRIPAGRRIYTFISNRGSLSPMHNMPCAVDYIGPTYRTAEFCFPIHLMKNAGADPPAFKVISEMVNWFWEGLP